MSQRGKRGNRLENDNQPPSKRRKGRPPAGAGFDNESEVSTNSVPVVSAGMQPNIAAASSSSSTLWQARSLSDLKISSIYNRSSSEAPAELFRKDLISAMKLPDSEPLSTDEYWIITDQWKQEWEKGVQVPVNPDSLPEPSVKVLQQPVVTPKHDFKPPKNKYIRITKDDTFSPELHYFSNAPTLAESACAYDLDQIDEVWLRLLNNERALCGAPPITDEQFERVIEELEVRCWDKIQAIMKSEEGLGIEYDENVICDVCRSPDSEEANEMVFCDNCNICVHQACYGITTIPSGQWLCRTCSMGKKPDCVLCPNKGGAMKSTRSGKKWAHVSCALWIPEVSIGCVDRMEPITKISSIPTSRWALICVLCRERVGACIQCSVKTCKTAYHVTCAFQHGLEMRAIIEEGNSEDGVKLRSYCLKHSVKGKKDNKCTNNNGVGSGSEDDECRKRKMRKDMTSEERNQVRVLRLQEVEAEFDKHVNVKDISCHLLEVDQDAIMYIYNYWILKRKSRNNRALIPPKAEDVDMIPNKEEQADIEKRIMVVHLRQDLERVRNLCYMVNRREKLSRSFFKMREQIFYKQIAVLSDSCNREYDDSFIETVINANNSNSVYDRSYSSKTRNYNFNLANIEQKLLGGLKSTDVHNQNDIKDFTTMKYTKIHVNGISDKKDNVLFDESCLSSNSDFLIDPVRKTTTKNKSPSTSKPVQRRKRRKSVLSSLVACSSSDDDKITVRKKYPPLHQMEKELARESGHISSSSNNSDELISFKKSDNPSFNKKSIKPIYSDTDSTDKERTDNTVSDSQHQMFRTKAAMKEFTLQGSKMKQEVRKSNANKAKDVEKTKINDKIKLKEKDKVSRLPDSEGKKDEKKKNQKLPQTEEISNKSSDAKRFPTDLLVVPQRQAAKKASENMRSTNLYSNSAPQKKDSRDPKLDEKDNERPTVKEKDKPKEREFKDEDRDKDKERSKPRGRPPKYSKEEGKEISKEKVRTEVKVNDQSSDQNKLTVDSKNNLLVAYVPQRQAAKKAAEHIKSGMGKSVAADTLVEDKDKERDKDRDREKDKERGKERDKDKDKCREKEREKESDVEKLVDKSVDKRIDSDSEKLGNICVSTDLMHRTMVQTKESSLSDEKTEKGERKSSPAIILTSSSSESSCCSSSCSSSSEESDGENASIVEKSKTKQSEVLNKSRQSSPVKLREIEDDRKDPEQHYVPEMELAVKKIKSPKNDENILHNFKSPRLSTEMKIKPEMERRRDSRSRRKSPKETAQSMLSPSKKSQGQHLEKDTKINLENQRTESGLPNLLPQMDSIRSSGTNVSELPSKLGRTSIDDEVAQTKLDGGFVPISACNNKLKRGGSSHEIVLKKVEKESHVNVKDSKNSDKLNELSNIKEKFDNRMNISDRLSPLPYSHHKSPEVIDIDSESLESIRSKEDLKERRELPSLVQCETKNLIKDDVDDFSAGDNDVFLPTLDSSKIKAKNVEKNDSLFDIINEEQLKSEHKEEPENIPSQQGEIFNPTVSCEFNMEPIFESNQDEEDSARETMNLVEKLRQKYKRSTSQSVKSDDFNMQVDNKEPENKANTSFTATVTTIDMTVQAEKNSSNSKIDAELNDSRTRRNSSDFIEAEDCKKSNQVDSMMKFAEETVKFLRKKVVQLSPSPEKDFVNDFEKQNEIPKQIGDVYAKSMDQLIKSTDCFDNISTSNFFKDDFTDIAEKDNISTNLGSSKIDCDYDENTRMQSPYITATNMWNENDLIQTRRSVSSSPSSISDTNDDLGKINVQHTVDKAPTNDRQINSLRCNPEIQKNSFNPLENFDMSNSQFPVQHHQQQHQQQHPTSAQSVVNGVDMLPSYNFPENNQYNGPVSLFPPQSNLNVQMPFPSPGAGLFPPAISGSVPFSQSSQSTTTPLFSHLSKQNQSMSSAISNDDGSTYPILGPSCGAAFTSSSHNLALTAAIVSTSVSSVPASSPQMMHNNFNIQAQNIIRNATQERGSDINRIVGCDVISNNNISTKDSPSKRTSARFSQQIKSPQMHKSPGKSPRQMELMNKHNVSVNAQKLKCDTGRQRARSTRGANGNRVRGRGRGRGRLLPVAQMPPSLEFDNPLGSIHNNLAGTVYDLDFDEDFSSSNVENLKFLRDRRRSFDCRNTHGSADSKFSSPNYHGKLRNSTGAKLMPDMKPPAMVQNTESSIPSSHSLLHNIHPLLPGPVDMRTYSSGFENQSNASQDAYNNHLLGAFATGTADQTLHDIDEEVEKEFQSALKASGTIRTKTVPEVMPELQASIETTSEEISIDSDTTNTKVSLSDSRNQLKLKIKGPLAHPDSYNSAPSCSNMTQNMSSQNINLQMPSVSQTSVNNTTGTSSLRRMRKKELLRQYWTQDMNMDDSACMPSSESKTNADQSINRCVGIPKAVDSMSSIPTKEDYKDYTAVDPRKRKRVPGMSRELRQLDLPYDSERPERRRSACSSGSNISGNNLTDGVKSSGKRRGKSKTHDSSSNGDGPKLKIKIKGLGESIDDRRILGCPPKKRLTNIPPPSLEILKRDCMNFRKQVMADFDEEEKEKKTKIKSSKKEYKVSFKKKKKSKHKEVEIVGNNAQTPKIILRIAKRKATDEIDPEKPVIPSQRKIEEEDHSPSKVDNQVPQDQPIVPIRLKIARNSDGDGYFIGDTRTGADQKNISGDPDNANETQLPGLASTSAIGNPELGSREPIDDPPPVSPSCATTAAAAINVIPAHKASDLKGQNKASKGCPLLPLNKDCEVR